MSTPNGRTDSLQICWKRTTTHHNVHAPRTSVTKHLLNYEPILLTFAVSILQRTTSSKAFVLFMFTHHACERACVSARVVTHSIIFGRILFKFDGHILQMTTSYTACASVHVRARVCEHTTDPQRLYEPYNECVNASLNSAHTSIYSRICQARDG
jgi:hypothetical protein